MNAKRAGLVATLVAVAAFASLFLFQPRATANPPLGQRINGSDSGGSVSPRCAALMKSRKNIDGDFALLLSPYLARRDKLLQDEADLEQRIGDREPTLAERARLNSLNVQIRTLERTIQAYQAAALIAIQNIDAQIAAAGCNAPPT